MTTAEARLNRVEGLVRALLSRPAGTGTITFTRESHTGADCSGSDGESNRILTLSSVPTEVISVLVSNAPLHSIADYNNSGNTIIFINQLNDDQNIEVLYV